MDSRLKMAASMVRRGSRAADIGADHAKLSIFLVQNGICPHCIATDINRGPAENAAACIAAAGLTDRIEVRLGGGLSVIAPHEADDIIIAGMGGETIADILAGADWIKNSRLRLVLQPMSRPEVLRGRLFADGFFIAEERVVTAGGHMYTVMRVQYDPSAARVQGALPAARYCGALNPELPADREYLLRLFRRLEKVPAAPAVGTPAVGAPAVGAPAAGRSRLNNESNLKNCAANRTSDGK